MRVVIDEYGGVAGLVTIEDLLEAIVGSIADEHDEAEGDNVPVREAEGTYIVPGSFEVSRLRELFADPAERVAEALETDDAEASAAKDVGASQRQPLYLPQHYEATTVGGLVSEIAGHIPLPDEVITGELLRFEVLASTDRKVDRVRVGLVDEAAG
jgi:CBS domain containing-hemolysin-like protein